MYFTDRGIEELEQRRGEEEVTLAWLAERLQEFTDVHPGFGTAVGRFAPWWARFESREESGRARGAPPDPLSRGGRGVLPPRRHRRARSPGRQRALGSTDRRRPD